ncbi:Similar to Tret1-2: Facilitated trehalose transporter Tret1-2 homolog (Drosophila melanogaster) [Cotesia congregata]|uniref:Similar to Tret1-2: Facilitated trehalose transporter Tret1-2 homolog (Drosophila melanogaster) n=1 Tax=Cotesia congregata TaxID=51543 RepID=A0A8J2H6U3_COTCN|nr:Similar to Tret1-2: Facilitated trehalose transporter Tret1-2 homolog (Drosophila melanogaster) [Cotesia congregata]
MALVPEIIVFNEENVKPKRLNQHISAIIISFSGFALGVTIGWNSSAGDTLRNVLNATATEIGLVGGIVNAGACAGRFLCGLAGGTCCVLSPIFISEVADKNTRVRLLVYFQLLINCGIFYAFLVAYFYDEKDAIWRYSMICGVSCALIIWIAFLPETPLYYLSINDEHSAIKSINWYYGNGSNNDLNEYKKLIKSKNPVSKVLKNFNVIRAIIVCHGVIIIQQLSGINTLTFYATVIFNNGGSGELTGAQQTLVIGGLQIISCIFCMLVIDFWGRRILLAVSGIIMGLSMILFGWYINVRDEDPEFYEESYGWIPPTCMVIYFSAFNLGLGPISWSILGDTFPIEIKTFGASSVAFLSWLISLIATLTFGELAQSLGISKTMWLFGGFCCLGAILCGAFVRETRGMSLADIQNKFKIDPIQVDNNLES